MDACWLHLHSVSSSLHLGLQTSLLLTLLSQPLLQLLLLLPHGLDTSLQLQHSTLVLSRQVCQTSRVPLPLTENLKPKKKIMNCLQRQMNSFHQYFDNSCEENKPELCFEQQQSSVDTPALWSCLRR